MNTEKTKVSPLYLQLIEGMHRDKLKINDAKLARHGSIDIDDHGFIDFPEFTFEPETCEDGLVHGCACIGRNFRRFLNEMPKYINPNSALACCWVGTFDRFAPFGIADEDKPHELDATIKKYRITQAGFGGMNHLCPDMEIGLREGWKGLLEKIRYYRKKNNPPDPDFYEGEEQLVLGILEWVKAHQVYAQELAAKESDPFLRDNYLAIAKVNGELCEHEPRTFREAVQFLAHFQAVDRTFYAGGALGALDTLLEEYFERDIESGILTEEEAVWMIASLFFIAAIAITGMPPLSGFIGKLLVLDGVRASAHATWFWALILSTSLIAIVGFARGGSLLFWKAHALPAAPAPVRRPDALPFIAVGGLLACLALLTLFAGPVYAWLELTAAQLYAPAGYIEAVLGTAGEVR